VFYIQQNLSKPNSFGTEEFVQFRQVFGLHKFKLHKHLVDGTVKSVWFRQVFGLFRVQFRQVFGLLRVQFRQVFGWFEQVLLYYINDSYIVVKFVNIKRQQTLCQDLFIKSCTFKFL
jgi:hypothetical protein